MSTKSKVHPARIFTVVTLVVAVVLTAINIWTMFEHRKLNEGTNSVSQEESDQDFLDQDERYRKEQEEWLDNLDDADRDRLMQRAKTWCKNTDAETVKNVSENYNIIGAEGDCKDVPEKVQMDMCLADFDTTGEGIPEYDIPGKFEKTGTENKEDHCRAEYDPTEEDTARIDKINRDRQCMEGFRDECDGETEPVCREGGVPASGNWIGGPPRVSDCWYKPNTGEQISDVACKDLSTGSWRVNNGFPRPECRSFKDGIDLPPIDGGYPIGDALAP